MRQLRFVRFFTLPVFALTALLTACSSTTTTNGGSSSGGSSSSSSGSSGSSSSSSGAGSACDDIAGTWSVAGTCGSDTCVITQNGCVTSFSCSGGSVSYTGSVSGSTATFSGRNGAGIQGTCTTTVGNGTMTGSCTPQGLPTCTVTAAKK
jgi:hypothetical protein